MILGKQQIMPNTVETQHSTCIQYIFNLVVYLYLYNGSIALSLPFIGAERKDINEECSALNES